MGDDRGGFYDHVVPPVVDMNGYGWEKPALLFWDIPGTKPVWLTGA